MTTCLIPSPVQLYSSFLCNPKCPFVAQQGLWFSDVSISEHFGKTYTLYISMDNNRFILAKNELTFNVTGCPRGYGVSAPTLNYTCSLCDKDYYNIMNEFVRQCHSCDSKHNPSYVT